MHVATKSNDQAPGDETYAVAMKVRDSFWIGDGPRVTHYLQRSLKASPAQIGCFVIGVTSQEDEIERFIVPDRGDGKIWTYANGLDDVGWLNECLRLFETVEEAQNATVPARWQKVAIYRFREDAENRMLLLELECQAEREPS